MPEKPAPVAVPTAPEPSAEPAPPAATRAAPAPAAPAAPAPAAPVREHRFDIDLLRLICSCAVMLGHLGATFIHAVDRAQENGPGAFWVGHVADSLNEFAVPTYFAVAGWAMLVGAPPRDERAAWKRIVRNALPLAVWTGVYLVWAWLRDRNEEPMTDLAVASLLGSVRPGYHLWFLYAYLPIIAVLAFVVLVRAGKRPWGLGAALLALAVLPSVVELLGRATGWDPPPVKWGFGTYSMVYAVLGALVLALPRGVPRRVRGLLVPGFLAAFAGCLWYNTQVHYVIPNAHLLVAALTACVLLLVARVRVPERLRPAVAKLAGAALGAYLMHVLVVEEVVRPLVSADLGAGAGAVLLGGSLLLTVTVSYAASLAWGRLGLRRYLG